MRIALKIVLSVFVCLVSDACAPRVEVPADAQKPQAEQSRSSQTIVGRGCVPLTGDAEADRSRADQVARAEVAKQLEVKVIQVAEDIQREEQKDGTRTASYSVSVQTQEFVDKTLKGVRIEERRRDEEQGSQCSVAALDKAAMASQFRAEIERDLQEIRAHLDGGESARAAGSPVNALRACSLALVSTYRVAVNEKMMLELGFRPPPVPSREEIRRKWTEALDGISLLRNGGEGQRGRPGSPLPEPLRVGASDRSGQPVQNLPLQVLRAPEGCETQARGQTNAAGEADFRVYRVVSNRRSLEEIAIGIDWEQLLAPETQDAEVPPPWSRWDAREVVFNYRIPVPSDYRVGVAVFESGTGRPLMASPIQSSILAGLQQVGFRTQDLFAAASLDRRPDPEQLRKLFKSKVDILVVGNVSLRFSSESSGFTFYRARGVVEGISLASGRTMVSLDMEAKGGGLDEGRAVGKALDNLATNLQSEVGVALERALD